MAGFRKNEVVKVKRETLAFWAEMLLNIAASVERCETHPFPNREGDPGPTTAETIKNYAKAIASEANRKKE